MASILIVEDHRIVAEVRANILRRSGIFELAGMVQTAEILSGLDIIVDPLDKAFELKNYCIRKGTIL